MPRCPMRLTSYLPDFFVFSSTPGAVCEVEDAEVEASSAALDMQRSLNVRSPDALHAEQQAGGTDHKPCVIGNGRRKVFHPPPPGMVRGLHTASGLVPRAVTLFPAVKVFSHVGKVLGLDGRVAWLKATQKRTLCGPTTTSASWKDRRSTPQTATDSPQRQAPFPEDPDALQFWVCYRARMSPKCGAGAERSELAVMNNLFLLVPPKP